MYDVLLNSMKIFFMQLSDGEQLDALSPLADQLAEHDMDETTGLVLLIYLQLHHGIELPEEDLSLSMTPQDIINVMEDIEPYREPKLTDFSFQQFEKLNELFGE